MTFDRSKFRASQASVMKQADKETESVVKNRDHTSADYLKIVPGSNKFRIYPFHPDGGGDVFAETKVVHWLEVDTPERDKEGKIIRDPKTDEVKMKRGSKPIFNSRVHGGTEKDIIEEYIKFAEKIAKDTYPKDEKKQKSFLEPIYGGFGSKYKGILARQTWVMYADKLNVDGSKVFGRLEVGKAVKQRLNAIAASESANEPLGTDPFTDPSDGRAINITYDDKAQKAQDYYVTEIYAPLVAGGKGQITLFPLSDADLEKFMKYPSLVSQLKNSYKRRDFDLAMSGLKIFDEQHHIGVFQYEAFLDIAEEISNYYPEDEEAKKKEFQSGEDVEKMFTGKNRANNTQNPAPETTETETSLPQDAFDEMDREELKEYCRDNKTGIIVLNKMSDDEIRNKLRTWYQQTQVEGKTEDNEKGDLPWQQGQGQEPQPQTTGKKSTADRLANLRKKVEKSA